MSKNDVAAFDVIARNLWGPFLSVFKLPREDRAEGPDEQGVREAIYDYCYRYDAGDIDGMMALFVADALLVNALGTYRGKGLIRQNYIESIARREFGFHFVTNIAVRFSPDAREAVAVCYLFTTNMLSGGRVTFVSGTYVDRLLREDALWKFKEKRVTADIRFTAPADASVALAEHPGEGRR